MNLNYSPDHINLLEEKMQEQIDLNSGENVDDSDRVELVDDEKQQQNEVNGKIADVVGENLSGDYQMEDGEENDDPNGDVHSFKDGKLDELNMSNSHILLEFSLLGI